MNVIVKKNGKEGQKSQNVWSGAEFKCFHVRETIIKKKMKQNRKYKVE